jgi:phosphoribosylaminoimidazole (AIR) synthetase
MIAIASPKEADAVAKALARAGETVVTLGNICKAADDARVVYDSKLDLG